LIALVERQLAAVLAYAKAPELVASLTLAATNVLADTPIPRPLQVVRAPFIGSLVSRILFGRVGLSMMWLAAVRRCDRLPFADYRRMLRFSNGITSTRRIFRASLCDLPGLYGPVQQTLASIRVPCAVLWGDRDPFFPVAVGERTAASTRFITLTGCGHSCRLKIRTLSPKRLRVPSQPRPASLTRPCHHSLHGRRSWPTRTRHDWSFATASPTSSSRRRPSVCCRTTVVDPNDTNERSFRARKTAAPGATPPPGANPAGAR
jgi:hypothetical protein